MSRAGAGGARSGWWERFAAAEGRERTAMLRSALDEPRGASAEICAEFEALRESPLMLEELTMCFVLYAPDRAQAEAIAVALEGALGPRRLLIEAVRRGRERGWLARFGIGGDGD